MHDHVRLNERRATVARSFALLLLATLVGPSCGGDLTSPGGPAPAAGSIAVLLAGLPANASVGFDLRDSLGTVQKLFAPDTVAEPGNATYSLTPLPFEDTLALYAPLIATQRVAIEPRKLRTVILEYGQTTGQLALALDGLDASIAGAIDVTGPHGFVAHLAKSGTVRKLDPGSYHIVAASVGLGTRFVPDTAVRDVRIDSAHTTNVRIRFNTVTSLTVLTDGLPPGLPASVDVTGPSTAAHLTATTTLVDLSPGSYTIIGNAIVSEGHTFIAGTQVVNLDTSPDTVLVHYKPQTRAIAFRLQTLPADLGDPDAPAVVLSGPAGTFSFSHDTTIIDLPPGTYAYTVHAPRYSIVSADGQHWDNFVIYSSSLDARGAQPLIVDTSATPLQVAIPFALVQGMVAYTAPGAPAVNLAAPGGVPVAGLILTPVGASFPTGSGTVSANSARPFPPGTYNSDATSAGTFPDSAFWPDVELGTVTLSAASPVVRVSTHYHPFVWPTVDVTYAGAPPGLFVVFSLQELFTAPTSITKRAGVLPRPGTIQLFGFLGLNLDTVAYSTVQSSIPILPQEGKTTSVVIQLRDATVLQLALSAGTLTRPPPGAVSFTFSDGKVVDASRGNDADDSTGTYFIDFAAGAVIVAAKPFTAGGVQWVPDTPTQTVTLPSRGRLVVHVAYHPQ